MEVLRARRADQAATEARIIACETIPRDPHVHSKCNGGDITRKPSCTSGSVQGRASTQLITRGARVWAADGGG